MLIACVFAEEEADLDKNVVKNIVKRIDKLEKNLKKEEKKVDGLKKTNLEKKLKKIMKKEQKLINKRAEEIKKKQEEEQKKQVEGQKKQTEVQKKQDNKKGKKAAKKDAKKAGKKAAKKVNKKAAKKNVVDTKLILPESVLKTKELLITRLEQELKLTQVQAANMADNMLATIDSTSVDPAIEKAKVVAKKVKKEAKIAAKHIKGKICGDELINLAKMYDKVVPLHPFDMKKMDKVIDQAVIKMTTNKKLKEARKIVAKSGIKKGLAYPKPPVFLSNNPLKLSLAEQYPEIARMIPDSKSFINFNAKVNAKQLLQNQIINNV